MEQTEAIGWVRNVLLLTGILSLAGRALFLRRTNNYNTLPLLLHGREHGHRRDRTGHRRHRRLGRGVPRRLPHAGQEQPLPAMAVVRRIYNGYRINRIGDYIRINPTGAVGLLVGMAVLLAFPPSPFFVSEVMLFCETIAGGGGGWPARCSCCSDIVIYWSATASSNSATSPIRDSLHPLLRRATPLSWAAFSLLAAAMVVGIWQPALLQQLIDQIVSL